MAPVKDIRMVKNKNTGQMRDFAFIEFYTIEVIKILKKNKHPKTLFQKFVTYGRHLAFLLI
jgi:RNA recognition motif-containing protein